MSTVLQKQIGIPPAAVTLVTTAETFVAYTGRCEAVAPTMRAIIKAWALITTGAGTTNVSLRIRRGNGLAGAVIVNGPPVALGPATQLDTSLVFAETLQNVESADYSLTVAQTGASGNGVVQMASIEVEMING
jgi:hypothetical protein